jgi:hypothetical protein
LASIYDWRWDEIEIVPPVRTAIIFKDGQNGAFKASTKWLKTMSKSLVQVWLYGIIRGRPPPTMSYANLSQSSQTNIPTNKIIGFYFVISKQSLKAFTLDEKKAMAKLSCFLN